MANLFFFCEVSILLVVYSTLHIYILKNQSTVKTAKKKRERKLLIFCVIICCPAREINSIVYLFSTRTFPPSTVCYQTHPGPWMPVLSTPACPRQLVSAPRPFIHGSKIPQIYFWLCHGGKRREDVFIREEPRLTLPWRAAPLFCSSEMFPSPGWCLSQLNNTCLIPRSSFHLSPLVSFHFLINVWSWSLTLFVRGTARAPLSQH